MARVPSEYKIITAVIFLIAVPSAVLCYVAIFALGREEKAIEMRLKSSIETAVEKAVVKTHGRLMDDEDHILAASAVFSSQDFSLASAFEALSDAAARTSFLKGVYVFDADGAPKFPALMPISQASGPPPPPADPVLLGSLQERLFDNMRLEFALSSPSDAIAGYRSLAETADRTAGLAGSSLAAQSLLGLARCLRKGQNPKKAVDALDAVVFRYPAATGSTGIPIAPGALLEKSRILRDTGDRDAAFKALTALALHLARNENTMQRSYFNLFRDGMIVAGDAGMEAQFTAFRTQVMEFDSFVDAFGALVRQASGGVDPKSRGTHFRSGDRLAFAVPLLLKPEGFAPAGTALMEIDVPAVSAAFMVFASDAGIEDRVFTVSADSDGAADSAQEPFAVKTFPRPLRWLEARVKPEKGSGGLATLSTMKWSLYFWIIIIASAVTAGGILFVIKRLSREMKLARDQSDFLSNVTHDLKTPLTSIRMFIETLQMGRVREESDVKECLGVMASETERLTRMIDRVLEFSRMERGRKRFDIRRASIPSIIERTLAIFRKQIDENECELSLNVPEGLPDVGADPDAIIEVLLNLLDNALKYSPVERKISIMAGAGDGRVTVAVLDRGIGISPKDIDRIFDPFYRAGDLTNREVEGTGLGLSHSRKVVRSHGGDITVESQLNMGSIFTVWLPVWKE